MSKGEIRASPTTAPKSLRRQLSTSKVEQQGKIANINASLGLMRNVNPPGEIKAIAALATMEYDREAPAVTSSNGNC
jgi:hypothetical protein